MTKKGARALLLGSSTYTKCCDELGNSHEKRITLSSLQLVCRFSSTNLKHENTHGPTQVPNLRAAKFKPLTESTTPKVKPLTENTTPSASQPLANTKQRSCNLRHGFPKKLARRGRGRPWTDRLSRCAAKRFEKSAPRGGYKNALYKPYAEHRGPQSPHKCNAAGRRVASQFGRHAANEGSPAK